VVVRRDARSASGLSLNGLLKRKRMPAKRRNAVTAQDNAVRRMRRPRAFGEFAVFVVFFSGNASGV
jgi:hypothetical protein